MFGGLICSGIGVLVCPRMEFANITAAAVAITHCIVFFQGQLISQPCTMLLLFVQAYPRRCEKSCARFCAHPVHGSVMKGCQSQARRSG
jgi:hypothetical protein